MAVYDDQDTKTRPERIEEDDLRNITGISPDEESKMEDSAKSGAAEDIAEKNNLGTDKGIKNSLPSPKGKQNFLAKRSSKIISGIVIGILTSALAAMITFFPSLIINHLSELIKGLGDVDVSLQKKYRRRWMYQAGDLFTKDGRRSGKIIGEMRARGLVPTYEADGKTLKGFQTIGGADIDIPPGDLISNHIEARHPMRSARWKTKNMESFYSRYNIPKKSAVLASSIDPDESIDRVMNRELAKTALGEDEAKLTSSPETPGADETVDEKTARENRQSAAREIVETDGSLDELKVKIKDGVPIADLTPDERAILRVGLDFDLDLVKMLNEFHETAGIGGRILKGVKGMAASAIMEIPTKICEIKNKMSMAILAARIQRSKIMARYASVFITTSDQIKKGGASGVAIGELMKRLVQKDASGRSAGDSAGFAAMLSGDKKFSKSRNNVFKSSHSVDGVPTGVGGALNDLSKGMEGCAAILNPFVQIGAGVGELALSLFTGGAAKFGSKAAAEGAEFTFRQATMHIIRSMLTKKAAAGVAAGVAAELTFQGAMNYIQVETEKNLSLAVTGQEKGGNAADIISGGGGVLRKQRGLKAGLVPATPAQYVATLNEYKNEEAEILKNSSFYARIFDYNNSNSLVFKSLSFALVSPYSPIDVAPFISNTISSIYKIPFSLSSKLASTLSASTYAQDDDLVEYDTFKVDGSDIEIATDASGSPQLVMLQSVMDIEPKSNIEQLSAAGHIESSEPYNVKSSLFKEHVTNCVENEDPYSVIEANPNPTSEDDADVDCLARTELARKFKAHLAYLDMTDGIDAYLFPEEISPESSSSSIGSGGSGGSSANDNISEPSYNKNPNVTIDGSPPGSHKTSNCTGTFTPGAKSIGDIIKERWSPEVTSVGGYSCRSIVGGSGTSIHGLGRAIDVMINANTTEGLRKGNEIRNWVINNSTELGIQRVIWNRHTWAANKDGWRFYSGTNPHTDHLHIEINNSVSNNPTLGR